MIWYIWQESNLVIRRGVYSKQMWFHFVLFLSPPVQFAWWAHMHRFLSVVCLLSVVRTGPKAADNNSYLRKYWGLCNRISTSVSEWIRRTCCDRLGYCQRQVAFFSSITDFHNASMLTTRQTQNVPRGLLEPYSNTWLQKMISGSLSMARTSLNLILQKIGKR